MVKYRKNVSVNIMKWLSSDHSLDLALTAPKLNYF